MRFRTEDGDFYFFAVALPIELYGHAVALAEEENQTLVEFLAAAVLEKVQRTNAKKAGG